MLYAIIATDKPGSLQDRLAARPAHLEYVKALQDEGRLVIAGPHPAIDSEDPGEAGFSGSLLIVEFDSLPDVEAWSAKDPYVAAGVFEGVVIKPFKKVFPMA
jgi:uncharacterized protein YciI